MAVFTIAENLEAETGVTFPPGFTSKFDIRITNTGSRQITVEGAGAPRTIEPGCGATFPADTWLRVEPTEGTFTAAPAPLP